MLELSKGTQLANRYTLVRPLGGGGEASVWLAKDKLTAANTALKIVSPSAQNVARLRHEWQTNIRLMHPHIARAFEFHSDDEVAFFSQQFIDGPNLRAVAASGIENILGPISYIVDALVYLHGKGLVHRDLKPENILLDANGAPYIVDFGMALAVGSTAAGGSPIAQSPEALQGAEVSESDDMFALGGLLYELISGQSPYRSTQTLDDIEHRVPATMVAASGESIPQMVASLIADLLHKSAAHRPNAEDTQRRLKAAEYTPATARFDDRANGPQGQQRSDEIVKQVSAKRRGLDQGPVASHSISSGTGLNRGVATAGLVLLVGVLLAVVFYLPERVRSSNEQNAASDTAAAGDQVTASDGEMIDPEVRRRLDAQNQQQNRTLDGDDDVTFSENDADYSGLNSNEKARSNAETAVGELLAALQVLEGRGVERWAPIEYRKARELYSEGDAQYLKQGFLDAEQSYAMALTVLEPLYDQIEPAFQQALADAEAAFLRGDRLEALRLYELAVAITPTHSRARAGYDRAKNLEQVLQLVEQGSDLEAALDLAAAESSYAKALDIDPAWQPAADGLQRVQSARTKFEFDVRMSEGFEAIAANDLLGARAAFRVAEKLMPSSSEPADGLLQVEQGLRMRDIQTLEREALALENDEHWDAAITTYEEVLKVDATLSFANEGLQRSREMSAIHKRLQTFIEEPDKLSNPATLQQATQLVVSITTRPDAGARLTAERDELSRLLKRAVTPLTVPIVSDNVTDVSIYRVGRLGSFMRTEVTLRPGTYVAVGIRNGYRDVREEFRVAPEVEIEPIVVRCEEPI